MDGIENLKLIDFAREVKGLTQAEFIARCNTPFLLVVKKPKDADSKAFTTLSPEEDTVPRSTQPGGDILDPEEGDQFVFALRKTGKNAFKNMVTLGRSVNNDVVLSHMAVSKLHAFFRYDAEKEEYTLTDVGSTNGTFVGEKRLTANDPHILSSRTAIVFGGAVNTTFFQTPEFHEYVEIFAKLEKL